MIDKSGGVPAGSELAVLQGQVVDIAVYRAPEVVLDEARKAAVALQDVISKKKDPVMMNGQQYLEYEDWQTVGRFYHVTAKVERTEYVQYGAVRGFSASAVALRSDGMEISRAEADCLSDEPKWSKKAKYEWRDKADGSGRERIHVGEEDVPLFQLKSMAQTRACAKALRNVLAWVVVLAGYRATPAEELEREQQEAKPAGQGRSAGSQPSGAASAPAAAAGQQGATTVKDVHRKPGQNARGPWLLFTIKFDDGRQGTTFSKTDGEHAERAKDSGALVLPKLVKTDKGWNLEGFEPLEKPKPKEEHPHAEQDEPISGPEKILTIREMNTEAGKRWAIQTDKRIVLTDQSKHQSEAAEARQEGMGLTPKVEIIEGRNRLLAWLETEHLQEAGAPAAQEAPAAAQAPKRDKAASKPARSRAAKPKDREPGEEG